MTERVDFYVLPGRVPTQRWNFACRLTEKAYGRDLKVVLWSENRAEIEALDELLWTFSEGSFVPHAVIDAPAQPPPAPVQLTADLDRVTAADLLVNLGLSLPARLERFARVAEIIDADEERRRLGRERFKSYRDLKFAIETHQLDEAGGA